MNKCVRLTLILGLLMTSPQAGFGRYHGRQEAFTQCLLRLNGDGDLELSRIVTKTVQEAHTRNVEVEVTVKEDGKDVIQKEVRPETYYTTRLVSAMNLMKLDPKTAAFFDLNGNAVSGTTVRAGLQKPKLILVSQDGKIHPSFAAIFKPGTLVLTAPPQPVYAMPPPIPVPVPAPAPGAPPAPSPAAFNLKLIPVQLVGLQPKSGTPDAAPVQERQIDFGLPAQPGPTFKYCKIDGRGQVALRAFHEFKVMKTAYKDIQKDGVTHKVPISIAKTISEDTTDFWDRSDVKFMGLDGKPLAETRTTALKQRESAVVVSGNGQPVDPFWLQNVNANTMVIALPVTASWYGHGPSPAVAPGAPPPAPAPAAKKVGPPQT